MKVIAKKGTLCPMDGQTRAVITDNKPVDVPNSQYYRRRILDGSLVLATSQTEATGAQPEKKGSQK